MNWLAENKFLAGFGAAMLVGVGALGYLTYSAMDQYDTATSEFSAKAGVLKSLVEDIPALTEANLKTLLEQKKVLSEKITAFRGELKKRVLPLEPIVPTVFQNELKDAVGDLAKRAAAAKVQIPKDIYLGFAAYQNAPPDAKAAPALARELKAIRLVMNILIDVGGLSLDELKREPLPEEGGKAKPTKSAAPQPGPGKKKGSASNVPLTLVERSYLQLKITATDSVLQKVISGLANHKEQLFVIRKITVLNKQAESPARLAGGTDIPAVSPPAAPDAAAPADPAAPPASAAPPPAPTLSALSYVFGIEEISATIVLEILNIADPK
jgi:hypothetical protein